MNPAKEIAKHIKDMFMLFALPEISAKHFRVALEICLAIGRKEKMLLIAKINEFAWPYGSDCRRHCIVILERLDTLVQIPWDELILEMKPVVYRFIRYLRADTQNAE